MLVRQKLMPHHKRSQLDPSRGAARSTHSDQQELVKSRGSADYRELRSDGYLHRRHQKQR